MGERCRCGVELLPHLQFCVGCGADRQAGPHSGDHPVPAQRREPAPTLHGEPVPTLHGEPLPPAAWPSSGAPGGQSAGDPGWQSAAGSGWQPAGGSGWQSAGGSGWPSVEGQGWQSAGGPGWPSVGGSGWQPPGPPTWQEPARRNSPAPWLIALSVLVVLLLAASAALVTLRPELVGLDTDPVVAPAEAGPTTPPSGPSTRATTPALSAQEELSAQVDRDRGRVESVTDSWVPQLSSKKPGTVDSGVTYDDTTILAHYRGLAAQYPGTALLWSGDWPVFKNSDYWVVISTESFPTAAQANAWCDAQGFAPSDCLAKKLSHSGGPAGTTVSR